MHVYYEPEIDGFKLQLKLIVNKWYGQTDFEIICYRKPILSEKDPHKPIEAALREFKHLMNQFDGEALFVGPDGLEDPKGVDSHSEWWLKIA